MTSKDSTVLEVLTATMGALPTFQIVYFSDRGRLKDRVLKHDLLHVLLIDREWPVRFRFEDEYSAAIIQAVLVRDSGVSARSVSTGTAQQMSHIPSPQEIAALTIPSVVRFLTEVFGRFGMPVPDDFRPPDSSFVELYYMLGQLFAQTFQEEFTIDYAAMPAETLKDVPFLRVAQSFDRAVDAYCRLYGHQPKTKSVILRIADSRQSITIGSEFSNR